MSIFRVPLKYQTDLVAKCPTVKFADDITTYIVILKTKPSATDMQQSLKYTVHLG